MKVTRVVNKEKRTCVFVISGVQEDVINKIDKVFDSGCAEDMLFVGNRSYIHDRYVGVAKCAPEDEFDEKIGMEIAKNRAYAQYNGDFNVEVNRIVDKLGTMFHAVRSISK